jgi:uncharacterized protein YdaU (DUF1376 family)
MAKHNVWMPLFVGDLIADTTHLSRADFGSYVLLICFYWRRREPLPDDDAALSAAARVTLEEWQAIRPVLAEFFEVADEVWRHRRIDEELEKSRKLYEGKRRGADKTNNARRQLKSIPSGTLSVPLSAVQSQSQSQSLERVHAAERPSLEEVLAYAQHIGLAPWKATDWFQEMEGGGWLDHSHRSIVNWRAVLDRVRTRWEADGRPMQPPTKSGIYDKDRTSNKRGTAQRPDRNAGTCNEGNHTKYGELGKVAPSGNVQRSGN